MCGVYIYINSHTYMFHRPGDKLMSRIPTLGEQVSSVLGTTMDALFGWGTLQDGWRKGPWTPQEDKLLIEHVNLHGEGRWNSVSKLTGLRRSGKSCRLRWVNYLRPDLKKGKITPLEEKMILELHARWGNRWSTIARSLPGRTDNEIKNYWRTHFKKVKSTKNVERARARFARQCQEQQQQQQQQLLLQQQEQEHQQQQEYQADMRGIMPQVEAAAIAHDMQEMAYYYYMNPIPYTLQSNGGSTREEASSGDCAWDSLWNLDDALAQGGFMVQDQILSTY